MATKAPSSVYWLGANGNTYVKSAGASGGVQDYGKLPNGATIAGSTLIADPNPPKQGAAPTKTTSTSATTYADKSNDIAQQNAGLNAVDTSISSGQSAVDAALARVNGTYDTEAGAAKTSYDTNTGQNKVNRSKNQQTALVDAAQGRQGLYATLASLGALNGSGLTLANNAVQKGANEDLAGADENYDTNAQALDSAFGAFTAQDKQRRDEAAQAAADAKKSVTNKGLQQRLGYYQNLANDYAAQGDKAGASRYTSLASSLFPEIASTNIPDTSPTYSAASYQAPTLVSYAGNDGNTAVNTTPAASGGIPGLVATNLKKKTPALAVA